MSKRLASILALALLAGALGGSATASAQTTEPSEPIAGCTYFAETGHNLCAGFRAYWERYGGLALFGYPITEEFSENGVTMQYFERARFEWHPGAWPERWDVLLGRLGAELTAERQDEAAFQEAEPRPGAVYFAETGHNLSAGFRAYWERFGGLAIFGYPISEEFVEGDLVVQYFERARFEWHPGAWPERYDVLLGRLGVERLTVPAFEAVAEELDNPRGLTFGPDGALYVAEAGRGGEGPCVAGPEGNEVCYGPSGALTRIADGLQERVATGLPSLAQADGGSALGPHDIAVRSDGSLVAVIGLGANPAVRNQLGEAGANFGLLVSIDEEGGWTAIADLAAYEAANDPDGAGPDSNPYAVLVEPDRYIVVDAGANALLAVTADGSISTLAVFPPQEVDAPPFLDVPPGTKIPAQSVPTTVVKGPDGAYYVGELTGFPFPPGMARIWRVVPGEEPEVWTTGFTNIIDLAFGPDGSLYVLEIAANGLLAAEQGDIFGALIRIAPNGERTTLVNQGLVFPSGLAIGPDGRIYVSANGTSAAEGQVVRIEP
ncbi:ScyD/ScyE family protein [Thermomicrobiaceae bacterium CFH 74404]|uniref:ScyD/ScyE family protein n=1 Tax=Thermalbibacter longus TaxID=2951981 RepID=A0AA42B9K1_9BACT|nr:ScyD/ScyE family protein [Thermalbibacter longus]MCM8748427.1 ScyD/ScyE family protein [Thermalbibacter longus]